MRTNALALAAAIRAALMHGYSNETIAARMGTTLQAVRVVRKGMKGIGCTHSRCAASRIRNVRTSSPCPWRGRFAVLDGTNVAGWSRRRGEPRLAQTLAICRWFADNGVQFSCWFDSSFRWCLRKRFQRDAEVLDMVLREEPSLFKLSPAGVDSSGVTRKADPYVIQDAATVPDSMIVSNDLYRAEVDANPSAFGWVRDPARRITGQIAANGDVLLGDNGLIRIPTNDNPESYIR